MYLIISCCAFACTCGRDVLPKLCVPHVSHHQRREVTCVGTFQWGNIWPYCMIVNNFSQAWALYVLMLFYMAMHTELSPLNPLRKFVTIKLVVFFSFWQGLVLTLLCSMDFLKPTHEWFRTYSTQSDFSGGIQDFIICIEMFFASIGFAWSFPPRDYMTGEHPGFWKSIYSLFDLADVVDDVQGALSPL